MLKSIKVDHREIGTPLPLDYLPSPHTVIVGRGKEPKHNLGNKRLRVLATSFLKKYQQGDKRCKTQIVSDIIFMIRTACKGGKGGFVKHTKNGQWYELDNSIAREKVGYVFRDLLADEYKSSSKSKVARRQRPIPLVRQVSASSSLSCNEDIGTTSAVTMDHSAPARGIHAPDAIPSSSVSTMTLSSHETKNWLNVVPSDDDDHHAQKQQRHSLPGESNLFDQAVESWTRTGQQQHLADDFVPLSLSFDEFDQEFLSRLPLLLA